ncbi:arsenate reductase [Phlyctema vagabunda]|uniref:Arsenate reductase n=1 Tax=Phlyctema vagabunda TaxID=108571 RepID=A0ABR4PQF9_9HELO
MRVSPSLLLPALIGAASAASEAASVYIFEAGKWPAASKPATLTPEEARLVLAHRLDVSQYHDLKDANRDTLSYINRFGGKQDALFEDGAQGQSFELTDEVVFVVEGVSSETAAPLLSAWESINPAFLMSNPPLPKANTKLVGDLGRQQGNRGSSGDCGFEQFVSPHDSDDCWASGKQILQIDVDTDKKDHVRIEEFMAVQERLRRSMNVVVILMPKTSRSSKVSTKPWGLDYGTYEMPSQHQLKQRQVAEEPMTEAAFVSIPSELPEISTNEGFVASNSSSNTTYPPLKGVIPFCHSSINECIAKTNNCSGHGSCFSKYSATDGKSGCFTCGCVPTIQMVGKTNESIKTTYWGGGACQKKDVSGPFWLLAGFSIILMAIVAGAIGAMFSIGEEKLPGVIGAGVSNKSR